MLTRDEKPADPQRALEDLKQLEAMADEGMMTMLRNLASKDPEVRVRTAQLVVDHAETILLLARLRRLGQPRRPGPAQARPTKGG